MITANNLGALYDAELGGDAVALIDCRDWSSPREYTHKGLNEAADAVARGLLARGLKRGDRIGLLSANRAEYLITYMGALRAGLVAVTINYKFPAETVAYVLRDSDIAVVFVDAERIALLPNGAPSICFDDSGSGGYEAMLDPGPFEPIVPDEDEVAMVLYTSGSTGRPKGVPLTHKGHLWALCQRLRKGWPFTHHRLLVAAPLFHMNALCTSLFTFAGSASQVLLPEFEAERYLKAIERFGCTWITSVPTMLAMCFARAEVVATTDLSSVEIVRMGSAPVSPRLWSQVREAFPKANIMNVYGTTEAGPVVFAPRADQPLPQGSVGWAAPEVELKLVDSQGREADEGVLWQRMPAVMPGYLNLPEKTAEVLTEDGWYISGDVFRRDADGAYYFVGRADDMFNCGGENIYPGEVEAVLVSHPDIVESCVVPVPDEIKGAKPVAFVVPRAGASLDAETVKQFTLANAPAYQHPRQVHFLEALPLAGPGKIDRKGLTERARTLSLGETVAVAGE